jgi:type II secretory pathway pseudopilin PulG
MQHRANKLRNYQITKLQNSARGYILITLMLFVALLAIAAMAVLPKIAFQIKRDREEEMIHRALEYSRAVKRYYKKFGRYPSRIEELENTNTIRFLRKRYKDPILGKDFKVLHLTDVMPNSGLFNPQAANAFNPQGGNAFNPQGGNAFNPQGGNAFNPKLPQGPGLPPPANAGDQNAGADNSGNPPNGQTNANAAVSSSSPSSSDTSNPTQQVFGSGGPILGVASASKAKTIRVFNMKDHYNDWFFVYLPQTDRGGMLNAPVTSGAGNTSFVSQPGLGPGQVPPNAGPPQASPPPGPPKADLVESYVANLKFLRGLFKV